MIGGCRRSTRERELDLSIQGLTSPRAACSATTREASQPRRGRCLRLLAQMGFSAILLGILLWKIDLQALLETIQCIQVRLFLAGMLLYIGGMILSAYRWQRLLAAKAIHLPLVRLVLFYFQGMFCNLFLPTAIGGDVLRGYAVYHASQRQDVSVVSVLVERLLGVAVLLVLAAIGLLMGGGLGDNPLVLVLFIGMSVGFLAVITLLISPVCSRLRPEGRWVRPVLRVLSKLRGLASHYASLPRALIEGFTLSVVIQLRVIFIYALLASGLDLHIPFSAFLYFVPIITLLSMLPISLGGLGIREGLTVLLFSQVGMTTVPAMSLSLAFFGVTLLSCLLGVFAIVPGQRYDP
jgi:uncharacterized protein (TIRG00374 family)